MLESCARSVFFSCCFFFFLCSSISLRQQSHIELLSFCLVRYLVWSFVCSCIASHSKYIRGPMTKYNTAHNIYIYIRIVRPSHSTFSHRIIEKLETKWMRYNWIDAWRLCQRFYANTTKQKQQHHHHQQQWRRQAKKMKQKRRAKRRKTKAIDMGEREIGCFVCISICVSFPFCVSSTAGSPCTHTHHISIYLSIRHTHESQLNYQQWQRTKT